MKDSFIKRLLSMVLAVMMVVGITPVTALAAIELEEVGAEKELSNEEVLEVNEQVLLSDGEEKTSKALTSVGGGIKAGDKIGTNGYYNVISRKDWTLVPGAAYEYEMVLNNANDTRRQVIHVIEVDPSNPDVSIVPGYNQIDKDLTKEANWSHKELTEMAKYYENNLGYNIVGGMNTDLYYDTYAPRILVYNGQDIGVKGKTNPSSSILYVFKDAEGNVSCDVKAYNKADFDKYLADGTLLHAVSVSFGMVVKDGELVSQKEERTSDPAARSMVGVKPDGTLVICMNDGRGANNSVGFCNYEEGEAMLALGCQWAANCDGGGSSTFLTKRVGEETFTMRSVPCDGAQRPTAHGIFVASNVGPTGELDVVNVESEYDIFAPKTVYTFGAEAIDTHGYAMDMPADASWALSDNSFGTIANGVFTSNGTKGNVDVQIVSGGKVVGSKTITVADPVVFALSATSVVIPYSTADKVRTITLPIVAMIGEANVYIDTNAVSVALSNEDAGKIDGFKFTSTDDTSIAGVNVIIAYGETALTYAIEFGKGSEVIFDFEDGEDGDVSNFLGVDEMYDWAEEVGATAPIQSNGNYSDESDSFAFLSTEEKGGQVRNGENALGITLDYTNSNYKGWCYNMFFYTGESTVLRDVANGKKATAFGSWVYIPEGSAGIAMQLSVYKRDKAESALGFTQLNFQVMMPDGTYQNLNALTEDKIPESRWVYCRADLTPYDFVSFIDPMGTTGREPSFMRYYVKPTSPAKYTFYFDDFTLDYSSAVDDRVLPTITNPTYSTSDVAVSLENGTTVNGNNVAFSATVADNAALDLSSGKIFVDGVKVESTIAGSALSTKGDVALGAGAHTVAFEVKDELGNPMKVTRTFTVAGDAAVELSGHNDSKSPAEADSIYYVDINVADLASTNKLVAQLKLNNANTWETEGAVVANGFKATFEYNEITEILTVTVEKDGTIGKAAENTLVSIPVRVWSWKGINHVTDTPIDPETQFASTYCPVVSVNCSVVRGEIYFANGNTFAFGGKMSHTTNLNVNYNPWHYHDAELTVLNKDATTTEAGYENRTYCETCKSVVDWGTIIPKIEVTHNYVLDGDKFVCSDEGCEEVYQSGTGIFEMNGDLYYSLAGSLKKGWQDAGDGRYCYAHSDYKLAVGEATINGITYNFDESGATDGAWTENATGKRYSYGPGFYRRAWAEIDGADYYFGVDAYMYTGIRFIKANPDTDPVWYDFGETGATDRDTHPADGLYWYNGDLYYCKDGVSQFGLQYVDGNFYYFRTGSGFDRVGFATRSESYYVSNTNGLSFANGVPVAKGTYEFDAEGKLIVPPTKHGVVGDQLFIDGVLQKAYQLVEFEGSYYFVGDYNKIIKNTTKKLNADHVAGTPLKTGSYEFDAEGKLIVPPPKHGIINDQIFVNGELLKGYSLHEFEGSYYFVGDHNKIIKNTTKYLTAKHVEGTDVKSGTYEFDAEGKLVVPPPKHGIIGDQIFVQGELLKGYSLHEFEGSYYFVGDYNKIIKNTTKYLTANHVAGTPIKTGSYEFDAEGKLIVPPPKHGIINDQIFVQGELLKGYSLHEFEGSYYFVGDYNKIIKNTTKYLTAKHVEGTNVKSGTYEFDANGKLVVPPPKHGIINDQIFINGELQKAYQLVEFEGDYYFIAEYNKIIKNTTKKLTAAHVEGTSIKIGTYKFGTDGKMIIG